ncbi:MAG: ABC transporter ATP-binding protein [Verrucomicrobia bacterium]|nr:ABC transporter ATP-binding protein [Verrucomicrobiota bacterium]
MPSLLQLQGVSKSFPAAEGASPVTILRDLDFTLEAGTSTAIIGPSGSGKSTLLHLLGSLDTPTSGQILFEGQSLSGFAGDALAEFRNRQIGFVFQSHHLLPQCSALENVLIPTLASPRSREDQSRLAGRAERLLTRVGLQSRIHHRPAQLSGGERQRVAVVRALILEPKLLLADEPTGALDRPSAVNLTDLLVELNRELRVTLLVVTHSLELARRMDRTLELRDGKLQPVTPA